MDAAVRSALGLTFLVGACRGVAQDETPVFVNPRWPGADPWVIRKDGHYYYCETDGEVRIAVWKSDRLTEHGVKRTVWRAPPEGWNARQVWAPELHFLAGRWYIYYAASWEPTYKLGLLELQPGTDPLDPLHWRKHDRPVFESTAAVCGVGHPCFVRSPDGIQDWIVYHAKTARTPGWDRRVCMQPIGWSQQGFPEFGRPAPWGEPLAVPSGER